MEGSSLGESKGGSRRGVKTGGGAHGLNEETAAATDLPSRQVVLWWWWWLLARCHPCVPRYFFLTGPLGGVTGLPELRPPYWYLAFFSEGFRIWKEHMRVSSTDIMPPALSNSPQ